MYRESLHNAISVHYTHFWKEKQLFTGWKPVVYEKEVGENPNEKGVKVVATNDYVQKSSFVDTNLLWTFKIKSNEDFLFQTCFYDMTSPLDGIWKYMVEGDEVFRHSGPLEYIRPTSDACKFKQKYSTQTLFC